MKKNVTDILDIHTHKLEADSLGKSIVNYPLLADSPLYMPFAVRQQIRHFCQCDEACGAFARFHSAVCGELLH